MNGKKSAKPASIVPKIFIAALATVFAVILFLLILGGRYITDDSGNKFVGFTFGTSEGRMLKSGTIYYADGLTAKVAGHGLTVTLSDGTAVVGATRIEFANGDVYEGKMTGLRMNGRGRFTWGNGDVYEGDLVNDEFTGSGVQRWTDGSMYVGGFLDSKKNGSGVYLWADCDTENLSAYNYDVLVALCRDVTTESKDLLPEGTWFAGNFSENRKSGYGIYHYGTGELYCGDFENDLKDGYGKFFYATGDVYDGQFSEDVRSGTGKYSWSDGKTYEGEFSDGTLNGVGVYTLASGRSYEGVFENGEYKGAAPEKSDGGDSKEGEE